VTDAARTLVLSILRQAAQTAPQPLRAGDFARTEQVPLEQVECCLELLVKEGMARKAEGGRPDDYVLTSPGTKLAGDPTDLDYFCAEFDLALPGEESRGNPRQRQAVAATLREPFRPRLNRLMVWANLLVFGFGLYLAGRANVIKPFLLPYRLARGNNGLQMGVVRHPVIEDAWRRSGLLSREDFLQGHWWRLLACAFTHIGLIHLAMNMLALRVVGANVEWVWGGGRYLVIYVLAALGASCAALTTAAMVAGASGAICGLVAAEGVWLILNRRYLPRRMVRVQLRNLVLTGLLIAAISMASMVSGAAHLGGAVVGAVAAILLHLLRFGAVPVRVVALLLLLVLPAGCVLGLQRYAERDPGWQKMIAKAERKERALRAEELRSADDALRKFEKEVLQSVIDPGADRRNPADVRKALTELPEHITRFRTLKDRLEKQPPARDPGQERQRQAALEYFQKKLALLEMEQDYLARKKSFLVPEMNRISEVDKMRDRWKALSGR
jgi:membrane associated rhomboid family serine protease